MFSKTTYVNRRNQLKKLVGKGIILFQGNEEVGMNFTDNVYPFRQDSTFLYYFGLDKPGLSAIIDIENDQDVLFADEAGVDDIIWMGQQMLVSEMVERSGASIAKQTSELSSYIEKCLRGNEKIHFLPQYRYRNLLRLSELFDKKPDWIKGNASIDLIKSIVTQRNIKDEEEIIEIDKATEITAMMHRRAMVYAKPGMREMEVVAELNKIALEQGPGLSFPCIITVKGEVLHNHYYGNTLENGQLLLVDSGAESISRYAGDMTRTFPVSGEFSEMQKQVYQVVLDSQLLAISMLAPGVRYLDLHLKTAKIIAEGLKSLGLMKGDMDEAVSQGAHALFFPHGLGHMIGFDVHDMENLGEEYVGYNDSVQKSSQFGLSALRLGKELETGHVLTIEPGIYFIPTLIDRWKQERKLENFIDYNEVDKYRSFGGIRIEDDFAITSSGFRLLGSPVPKEINEIEAIRKSTLS
jgi:Xaa-Pro aminopeptidase